MVVKLSIHLWNLSLPWNDVLVEGATKKKNPIVQNACAIGKEEFCHNYIENIDIKIKQFRPKFFKSQKNVIDFISMH